jgi:ribose transport system permease protein
VSLRRLGTPAAFLLICIVFSGLAPAAFASVANVVNLMQQMAMLAIIASGATLVMVVGEFDLSIGFVASLAAVMSVALMGAGVPVAAAIAVALAGGTAAGLANGLIVSLFAAPSFVATLAIGTLVSGLAYKVSGGASLFQGVPASFTNLARASALGVPSLALWMAAVLAVTGVMLNATRFGRHLHAIGGNREAARLSGLMVERDRTAAFALAGGLAALAGVLLAARLGSAQHTSGEALLLPAYAAVFLGMTASPSGVPSIPGTLLGVAITAVLANGLTILGVEPFVQKMVTGGVIILALVGRRFGRG